MMINPNVKFFIINANNKIKDFYIKEESAKEYCDELNTFYNGRPRNEFGYMMGEHDYSVKSINDLFKYKIDLPKNCVGALVDNKFYSDVTEAINECITIQKPIQLLAPID